MRDLDRIGADSGIHEPDGVDNSVVELVFHSQLPVNHSLHLHSPM